jgi:hypothetical protein
MGEIIVPLITCLTMALEARAVHHHLILVVRGNGDTGNVQS